MRPITLTLYTKSTLLLFFVSFFTTTLLAQTAPPMQWLKSFGGTSSESPNNIVKMNDGGYIIAGWAQSNDIDVTGTIGAGDVWVIRLDSNGTVNWKKCFGSIVGGEAAYDLIKTVDGNLIMVGTNSGAGQDVSKFRSNPNYLGVDVWVMKFSVSGTLIWEKSYGGIGLDRGKKIVQTTDGGYVFMGSTISNDDDVSGYHGGTDFNNGVDDIWVVKIDSIGKLEWQRCLGGTRNDVASDLLATVDGGVLVAGQTRSKDGDVNKNKLTLDSTDVWLIKINANGNIKWNKLYGGTNVDGNTRVVKKIDGGYAMALFSMSSDGDFNVNKGKGDIWIVGLDDTGKIQWKNSYGGSNFESPNQIIQTPDSGFVVACVTNSNDKDVSVSKGNNDWWLLKVDKSLNIEWEKSFGTLKSDYLNAMLLTDDGYILVGEMWDNSGDLLHNHKGLSDWVVIKLGDTTVNTGISEKYSKELTKVYPSPTSGLVHIELPQGYEKAEIRVYDIMGKLIDVNIVKQWHGQVVDLSRFAASAYTIQVIHNGQQQSYKVIKQ